jgi:hypothetical protein
VECVDTVTKLGGEDEVGKSVILRGKAGPNRGSLFDNFQQPTDGHNRVSRSRRKRGTFLFQCGEVFSAGHVFCSIDGESIVDELEARVAELLIVDNAIDNPQLEGLSRIQQGVSLDGVVEEHGRC